MSSHSPDIRSPYLSLLPGSQNENSLLGAFVLARCSGDNFSNTSTPSAIVGLKIESFLGPSVGDDGRGANLADIVTKRIDNFLGPCVGDDAICDRRLKRNVRAVDTLPNGLKLHSFRYWNDERTFVGVMAQDLLQSEIFSHAVHASENGYYTVDFAALDLEVLGDKEAMHEAGRKAIANASPGRL